MSVRGVLSAALVESAIISWRDLSGPTKMPPAPSEFVAVILIFGGLSLFPESASSFASVTAWGFVVATFLNLWSPASPTKLAIPGGTATVRGGQVPVVQKTGP